MSITKPKLVKYVIPRVGKGKCPVSKSGKEFQVFLIVVFLFSTTFGTIFLICIFYHLWYCHLTPFNIFHLWYLLFSLNGLGSKSHFVFQKYKVPTLSFYYMYTFALFNFFHK